MVRMDVKDLPLFKDLSVDEVKRFIKQTGATTKVYPKGARLLNAYEPNPNIGVVVEGMAQLVSEDRMGNETVGPRIEHGAIIGSTSAILNLEGNLAAVEALSEIKVLWIPYQALITAGPKLSRIHGIVMKNMLEAFCVKHILMMEKIEVLSHRALRERVILYLLQSEKRQQREDGSIQVPGRVQLAKELECNRSALTREISSMKREGILNCGRHWMKLNKDKLNDET